MNLQTRFSAYLWLCRCIAVLIAAAMLAGGAQGAEHGVIKATLKNGLRVIIVRNDLAPVVSTAVNYFVGADETPPGFPGTAHALEHMMFRGSPGLSATQLADIGNIIGGNFNANTQQTLTQYLYSVPADNLDIVLRIEALRMRDLTLSASSWQQERGALLQEIAQDLSSPFYVLSTQLRETLFAGTGYAHDALGTRESLMKTTAPQLKRFHRTWYAPNNALLVVVGDVDPPEALKKIKAQFESIPQRKLPARGSIQLRPVTARNIALDTDLPYTLDVVALRVPGLRSPDYPAVQVLADVLNSQRGPLYALVPEGKALGTQFVLDAMPQSGIAYAVAASGSTRNATVLQTELRTVLAEVAKNGVAPELVDATKRSARRELEVQKNSINGLASAWSRAVAVEGLDSPQDELRRIESVTIDDVNRAARRYLDLDHAVTAVLTPTGSGKPISSGKVTREERITLADVKPTALPAWARKAIEDLKVPQSKVHPVVTRLSNGITLLVQPETISNTVSVYGHVNTRSELMEPAGKEGLSDIAEQLFSYGTKRLDRLALQAAYDELGADARAGRDFGVEVLTEDFSRAVALLAENELAPAFPEDAFKVVKKQALESVESRLTSPGYLSERALVAALFPKGDPALREAMPATVDAVTLEDVREYYRASFRPDLTTIVVIGNVTPESARAAIEKDFGAWSAEGPKPLTDLPPVPPNPTVITAVPDKSRVQDRVTLAQTLDLVRANPDYYPLQLGNTVLGGAFYSSRLSRDIRMSAGLVYAIDSGVQAGKTRSVYSIQYASDPQNVSRVHAMIERELQQMRTVPVTSGELQRAKALLVHRIPLEESSISEIAQRLIGREVLELPLDEPTRAARRYLDTNAEQVRAIFNKYVAPERLSRVSQGLPPQ
ncbi:MAG: M16 family metallopeptidase [Burkholderiales bacterium]